MNYNVPYVPSFTCEHCGETTTAQVNGEQGMFVVCDCEGARKAWEQEHRASMERRKRARRGI